MFYANQDCSEVVLHYERDGLLKTTNQPTCRHTIKRTSNSVKHEINEVTGKGLGQPFTLSSEVLGIKQKPGAILRIHLVACMKFEEAPASDYEGGYNSSAQ